MTEQSDAPGEISQDRLKTIIQRIEKAEQERADVSEHIKDIYAEAKGTGFDTKIIRKIVALRKQKVEDRRQQEELLELYKAAIGMEV